MTFQLLSFYYAEIPEQELVNDLQPLAAQWKMRRTMLKISHVIPWIQ